MNANLRPKLQTIREWIDVSTLELRDAGIDSAQLDAEIILAHTIRKPRTWLHAHDDEWLEPRQREIADARLVLRSDRTPLAYIIGHKEFYGRRFSVSPAVLVPRPESEAIIDSLKQYLAPDYHTCVDVGTGSGILAITAQLEFPQLEVVAYDIDQHALNVAERNARAHAAEVMFRKGDLLTSLVSPVDVIIANLPYVDEAWEQSKELAYEPSTALYAKQDGLALIFRLIPQTGRYLNPGGLLLLEADDRQHQAVIDMCIEHHLTHLGTTGLALAFVKD